MKILTASECAIRTVINSGDKPFFKEHPEMVAKWTAEPTMNAPGAKRFFENKKNFQKPSKLRLRWNLFVWRRKWAWNLLLQRIFLKLVFFEKTYGAPVLNKQKDLV